MSARPKSAYATVGGMNYFPRMLDKIRLHARDELHADYHPTLGIPVSADGLCCRFLRVRYGDLKARVLTGGTDDEILEWCLETGRKLDEVDLLIWNDFIRKIGWNDMRTPFLEKMKAESGLAQRSDIVTVFDYCEVDEGRKP